MDPVTIIGGISAAAAAGFGISIGTRIIPASLRAQRDLAKQSTGESEDTIHELAAEDRKLIRPVGRKRESSIVGIFSDALRHGDGAYTRGYHVELAPTLFSHEGTIERRCDELARMLAVKKPPGTVIQFRLSVGPDAGEAIRNHVKSQNIVNTHPLARELHGMNLNYYSDAAANGLYRRSILSCWVRVPIRHANDESSQGAAAFFSTLNHEIGRRGLKGLTKAIRLGLAESGNDGLTGRLIEDETVAREQAERVFRLIERECPLSLKGFTGDELWNAIYLGHRQNARAVPRLIDFDGRNLCDYLCGETIEAGDDGDGWYVMHGNRPAAIISLFAPPQPTVSADALRALSSHPALNFRHTIITEYIYPDQTKAIKRLDKRIRQVRRTRVRADGRFRETPEAKKSMTDLTWVRDEVTGAQEALVQARFYAIVYGAPARTGDALDRSLKQLERDCDELVSVIRTIPGAEAEREEPAAIRALYQRSLVGELNDKPTGREITEVSSSLAPLIPTESAWGGQTRPHTLLSTVTGRLIGIDLFETERIPSPLVLDLGAPGSGKSVLMARIVSDVLASKAEARVRAVDFGESFGPLVDVLEGRHLRFTLDDKRTINIWDYEDLSLGEMPDEVQIALVVEDLLKLARVQPDDNLAEDILTVLVTEVYKNEVPRNTPGWPKHEPTHSHLLNLLKSYPFKGNAIKERAVSLALALEKYRGHAWLDAATHPDFASASAFDVFELDSLENFPRDVRESLAYRIGVRVTRSIGQLKDDGTRTPTLLCFDEVWKIRDSYPQILQAIKKGARTGRKEGVVTILATHGYEDLSHIIDLAKTSGVKLIGKQIGDYSGLMEDSGLSPAAGAAINGIRNVAGSHAQFVSVIGSGEDQIVEMVQVDLSPAELWTFTSNPNERNARARVRALRPAWLMADVVCWLAENYPRGLAYAGLTRIDEELLP